MLALLAGLAGIGRVQKRAMGKAAARQQRKQKVAPQQQVHTHTEFIVSKQVQYIIVEVPVQVPTQGMDTEAEGAQGPARASDQGRAPGVATDHLSRCLCCLSLWMLGVALGVMLKEAIGRDAVICRAEVQYDRVLLNDLVHDANEQHDIQSYNQSAVVGVEGNTKEALEVEVPSNNLTTIGGGESLGNALGPEANMTATTKIADDQKGSKGGTGPKRGKGKAKFQERMVSTTTVGLIVPPLAGPLEVEEFGARIDFLERDKEANDAVRALFASVDADGGGFITVKELGAALRRQQQYFPDGELQDKFDGIDADGSGTLSFHEFLVSAAGYF